MTRHRLINWLLAWLMAAMLCLGTLLDGPSDYQAELDVAQAVREAQTAAMLQSHLEQEARRICSQNAACDWALNLAQGQP